MAFECKICELNFPQTCFLLGRFGAWNVTIHEFLLPLRNQVRQPEAGMSLLQVKDDTRRGRCGVLLHRQHYQKMGSGCAGRVGLDFQASLSKERREAEPQQTLTGPRMRHQVPASHSAQSRSWAHSCFGLLRPLSRHPRGQPNLVTQNLLRSLRSETHGAPMGTTQ